MRVVVFIELQEGKKAQVQPIIKLLIAQTKKQPGCKQYDFFQVQGKPNRFIAYQSHRSAQHTKKYIGDAAKYFAGPLDINVINQL